MIRALSFAAGAVALVAASAIVLSGDERDRICRPGAAQAGRPSPEAWLKLRQEVFLKAGVSFPAHHADYEVDHRISVSLGGASTLDNLQIQSWTGPWNARDKDELEFELWLRVCRHHTMDLQPARTMLNTNWCDSYMQIFGRKPASAAQGTGRPVSCRNPNL